MLEFESDTSYTYLFTLSQSTFIIFPNCRVLLHLKVLFENYCSEYSIQYTFLFCWLIMEKLSVLHLVLCNATYYSVLFYRKLCLVRYDAFLKFLILLSPFSIFVYSNLERFYQPAFSYFVTGYFTLLLRNSFMFSKCLWFYSKLFFFFSPLDASVPHHCGFIYSLFNVFPVLSLFLLEFFSFLVFFLSSMFRLSHTIYKKKKSFLA